MLKDTTVRSFLVTDRLANPDNLSGALSQAVAYRRNSFATNSLHD